MNGDAEDTGDQGGTAPCFAHELTAGFAVDSQTRRDVARFRKAERARLYQLRKDMTRDELRTQAARIADALDALLGDVAGRTIAGYWPIRGELDMRPWMTRCAEAGARIGLPVVLQKAAPVEFHAWAPRAKMERGVWNIPVPQSRQPVTPDVVIVPLLGVDDECYRLGNGGGYYDRTLAAFDPAPQIVGIGHDFCALPTIFPQPWDIPMDVVLLGDGSTRRRG
ncbi:5-formyltetrahydrofolate cyclo-ligase [Roseovarius spongiae]|uniref:5-formyltetrahydrofolate cyclo-ligase n=1 Tax=Roseovarius spongiae TaxID=2320272 RepID=A0A3A8ASC2_9RHOB|nr:5-formyltetrahydrofolate cyclo-ligase [Roseovarius spongiae]RKF13997.1 5-formyltetrahydrofolate cyclo-ligase [Roseovarius spongiae]